MSTLLGLVYDRKWDEAAAIVSQRFSGAVMPGDLATACEPLFGIDQTRSGCLTRKYGSDSSLICWLASRVRMDPWPSPRALSDRELKLTMLFHIGFVFIEETAEMVACLAEADVIEDDIARSKIFSTNLKPKPIDRVARRVAPDR